MKKVLLIALIIISLVFALSINGYANYGEFYDDGYVLTDNQIQNELDNSTGTLISALKVNSYDTIYKKGNSFYVGEDTKQEFTMSYPMYLNDGTSIKLLNNNAVLIDEDFIEYESYSGLILNEGSSFNEDKSISDFNNYIFARINSDTYINTGYLYVDTLSGSYSFPTNSIIKFNEESIKVYVYDNGTFAYKDVLDCDSESTLRINNLEINYFDFLKGIGVIYDQSEQEQSGFNKDKNSSLSQKDNGFNDYDEKKYKNNKQKSKPADNTGKDLKPKDPKPGEGSKAKVENTDNLIVNKEWVMPEVTEGDVFIPGAYSLKINVKVNDPASVINGGITYTVYEYDSNGNEYLFKRSSFSSYLNGDFTDFIISGLKPETNYSVVGEFRYKDKFGRTVFEPINFFEKTKFTTKPFSSIGPVYLEDFGLENANIHGDSIEIPHFKFVTESDPDGVGCLSKVVVRFTTKDTYGSSKPDVESINLSSGVLEIVKSLQSATVNSGKILKSSTNYVIDVICYDRFSNQLTVINGQSESRTCKTLPKADFSIDVNDDLSMTFKVSIKDNIDNLSYSDSYIKIMDKYGQYAKINGSEKIPFVDGIDFVISSLEYNKNFTAQAFLVCDDGDGKGEIERSIGSKSFVTSTISKLGPLYLNVINKSKDVCPDELFRRQIFEISLNKELTNPSLLDFVDIVTIKLQTGNDLVNLEFSDDELARLKQGETIIFDTDNYDVEGGTVKSKSKYRILFGAQKVLSEVDNEFADIKVNATLTSFDTPITPPKVLITDLKVYEGYIGFGAQIVDVDDYIVGNNVYLNIKSNINNKEELVTAYKITKNSHEKYLVKMCADSSESADGRAYDILPNTEYIFDFRVDEAVTEKGLKPDWSIYSFKRTTNVSLTGSIYSGGLVDNNEKDANGNSLLDATIYLDISDPEDFLNGTTDPKVVYVDEYRNTAQGKTLIETRSFPYEGSGFNKELRWVDYEGNTYSDTYVKENSDKFSNGLTEKATNEGFTRLDSLTFNGSGYVDTHVIPSSNMNATLYFNSSSIQKQDLIGSYVDENNRLLISTDSLGKGDTNYSKFNSSSVGIDNFSISSLLGSSSYSIYIGASNRKGIASNYSTFTFYDLTISDNDSVLYRFVPVKNIDGKLGIYDLISDSFCQIVGEATEGNLAYYINELPIEYTQVEYIQSSGTQFVDTNKKFSYDTDFSVDIRFMPLTAGNRYCLFSGYSGNPEFNFEVNTSNNVRIWLNGGSIDKSFTTNATNVLNNATVSWNALDKLVTIDCNQNVNSFVFASGKGICRNTTYLFQDRRSNSGGTFSAPLRIYSYKYTQNNDVISNFVACYNNVTKEFGFYDLVEDTFYKSKGSGSFLGSSSINNLLVPQYGDISFTSKVLKDTNIADNYEYKLYFKLNAGTPSEVNIPLSSVAFSTEQEILTIASGEEFIKKAVNNKKYIVINDISIDATNASASPISTMYANVDFQGFSFDYYVNRKAIINKLDVSGSITNAVLKSHGPLYRVPYSTNPDAYITTYDSSIVSNELISSLYGTVSNVKIEMDQEKAPYVYEDGKYWSDLSPEEINELRVQITKEIADNTTGLPNSAYNKLAASKYPTSFKAVALCNDLYGVVENFVLDIKTELYGTVFPCGLTAAVQSGGVVRNGYVFSSTLPNNKAVLNKYDHSKMSSSIDYGGAGGVAGNITGKGATVQNVYSLCDVINYQSTYLRSGSIVGVNSGSGAVIQNCYSVGNVTTSSTGKPYTSANGPALGKNSGTASNVYYISDFSYNNTFNSSSSKTNLRSVTWQENILNTNKSNIRFNVEASVGSYFYPQVIYTSNVMPAQSSIPLPSLDLRSDNVDVVYAFTYTPDVNNPFNNMLVSNITGNKVRDNDSDSQVLVIMLADKSARDIYSVKIDGFNITNEDILAYEKDGEGLTTIYVKMHDPEECLTNYMISSVTFALDSGLPDNPTSLPTKRPCYIEFYREIDSSNGENSWVNFKSKFLSGSTCNENIVLNNDIDFSGVSFEKLSFSGVNFVAKFNGNNKIIKNIDYDNKLGAKYNFDTSTTNSTFAFETGLFGKFTGEGSDVVLDNIHIESGDRVGAFASYLDNGSISNISVRNSYIGGGSYVGGLIGQSSVSNASRCSVIDSKVINYLGGFVSNTGSIGIDISSNEFYSTGGFVGKVSNYSDFERCFVQNTYIESQGAHYSGGFAGFINYDSPKSSIKGCYSTGELVTMDDFSGGFVGMIASPITIESCYSDMDIYSYGALSGGFCGGNVSANVSSVVSFGDIISCQVYNDEEDEHLTLASLQGLVGKSSGTFTGGVFDGININLCNVNSISSGKENNINCALDPAYLKGATAFSFDEYCSGRTSDFLSSDYFYTLDQHEGILPRIIDTSRNILDGQALEFVGSNFSSSPITLDSITATKSNDLYNIKVTIKHRNDIEIIGLDTDFTFVDENVDLIKNNKHEGYNTLTKHKVFDGYKQNISSALTDSTISTTIVDISGADLLCAYDKYFLYGLHYKYNGNTGYYKIGKQIGIDQQFKEINDYNDWFNKVTTSHFENFNLNNDIDFSSFELHSYDGTSNMIINRLIGTKGDSSNYVPVNPEVKDDEFVTLSGIILSETQASYKVANGWQNNSDTGFIKAIASEISNITFDDVIVEKISSARNALISRVNGKADGLRLTNSKFNGRASGSFIHFSNNSITNVFLYNIDYTANTLNNSGFLCELYEPKGLNAYVSNITADKLTAYNNIDVDYADGGLINYVRNYLEFSHAGISQRNSNMIMDNISVSNSNISGKISDASFVASASSFMTLSSISLDNCKMTNNGATIGNTGLIIGFTPNSSSQIVTLDGATINNCIINCSTMNYVGLACGNGRYSKFLNIDISNSSVTGKGYVGGAIGYTYGNTNAISNVVCDNIHVNGTSSYVGGVGGGYYATHYDNCTVKNSTISNTYTGNSFTGGIYGASSDGYGASNNQLINSTVTSKGSYVSGIGSRRDGSTSLLLLNSYVEGSTIKGVNYVGGIQAAGYTTNNNNTVENSTIIGTGTYVGGGIGCVCYDTSTVFNSYTQKDNGNVSIFVNNCTIYGGSRVGGAFGYSTVKGYKNGYIVENSEIRGFQYVGGISGGSDDATTNVCRSVVKNSFISVPDDSIVSQYNINTDYKDSQKYFGAVYGLAAYSDSDMAENCIVYAPNADYVGGIGGRVSAIYEANRPANGLISKDCVVVGRDFVGGLFGTIRTEFNATYCSYSGTNSETYRSVVSDSYSNALVYGNNYVAGIAGAYEAEQGTATANNQADVYTLTALVKNVYFTGALNATADNGRAAGVFAYVNALNNYNALTGPRWLMKLDHVASFPDYIRATNVDPVITTEATSKAEGFNKYNFNNLAVETTPGYVSISKDTKVYDLDDEEPVTMYYYCSPSGQASYISSCDFVHLYSNNEIPSKFTSDILNSDNIINYYDFGIDYTLPSEYTALSYIESTGTQFINTGYIPSKTTEFEMIFNYNQTISGSTGKNGYGVIFGSRTSSSSYCNILSGFNSYSTGYFGYGNNTRIAANIIPNQVNYISLKDNVYSANGVNTAINPIAYPSTFYPLYIFNLDEKNKQTSEYSYIDLYSLKIWDNDIIVRDFIPCKRNSDSAIGLYDKINNKFYTNSGTGTFVAGLPVNDNTINYCPLVRNTASVPLFESVTKTMPNANPVSGLYLSDSFMQGVYLPGTSYYYSTLSHLEEMCRTLIITDGAELPKNIGPQGLSNVKTQNEILSNVSLKADGIDSFEIKFDNSIFDTVLNNDTTIDQITYTLRANDISPSSIISEEELDGVVINKFTPESELKKSYKYDFGDSYQLMLTVKTNDGNIVSFGKSFTNKDIQNAYVDDGISVKAIVDGVLYKDDQFIDSKIVNIYGDQFLRSDGTICDYSYYELPIGYKEVEYVESTGSQWIDTGVNITQNLNSACELSFNKSYDFNFLYGTWSSYGLGLRANNVLNIASGGKTDQSKYKGNINTKYLVIQNPTEVRYNDNVITIGNGVNSVVGAHFFLFSNSNGAGKTPSWYGQGKLYRMIIFDGETMIKHLVPSIDPSGVIGMYDLVDNQFYVNQGSGVFKAGALISHDNIDYNDFMSLYCNGANQFAIEFKENIFNLTLDNGKKISKIGYIFVKENDSSFTEQELNERVITKDEITNPDLRTKSYRYNFKDNLFLSVKYYFEDTNYICCNYSLNSSQITPITNMIYEDDVYSIDEYNILKKNDTPYMYSVSSCYNGDVGLTDGSVISIEDYNDILANYTPIEYLESTGSQWIDTGITITKFLNSQCMLSFNKSFDFNFLYGTWSSYGLGLRANNVLNIASGGKTDQSKYKGEINTIYTVIQNPNEVRYNDNVITIGNGVNSVVGAHFFLFSNSNGAGLTPTWYGQGKLYYMTIYDRDEILSSLIPVKRSDGVLGMLDVINNQFYTNRGAGTFKAGAELEY